MDAKYWQRLLPKETKPKARKGTPKRKLTADDVREIRKLQMVQKDIAAMYGVDPAQICRIRKRELWRDVD